MSTRTTGTRTGWVGTGTGTGTCALIYHDFPGIMRYMENPDGSESFFSPRSSGYARYNVNQSKKELHKKDA